MSNIQYFTPDGLEKLKADLEHMTTKGRAEMSQQIAEARDKGDLSENAEYDAAKEAQGMLEMKINQLQETLANARLLDESAIDTSKVLVLCTVKVKNLKTEREVSYTLVSENEADLKARKISVASPIGKGLLGKKVGEKAEIQVPAGLLQFEVLEITRS